jgi:hypothetical protein
MRMHQVEVDDEVFSLVKAHAEPLVDTFNSSLRRLLPLGESDKLAKHADRMRRMSTNAGARDSVSATPSLPAGTPEALRQIFEVICLVQAGAYTRTAATNFVAKQRNVFPQTVVDKYGRQLGLTASQFDRLLEQKGLGDLSQLLKSKFPEHTEVIDDLLSEG